MLKDIKKRNCLLGNTKQYFLKAIFTILSVIVFLDNTKCQIISSLEMRIKYYESEIQKANDSIKFLKNAISVEQSKLLPIVENKEFRIKTFVTQRWYTKFLPAYESQNVEYLDKGKEIIVIGYFRGSMNDYFVKLENGQFFWDANIIMTDSLIRIKQMVDAKYKAKRNSEDSINQRRFDKEAKERKAYLIKRYGTKNAEKILNNQIWLGMTDKILIEIIGKPNDINRTIGSFGIHEQWVYNGVNNTEYYYFENGKLKTWQD
jgi:hypothetical protein